METLEQHMFVNVVGKKFLEYHPFLNRSYEIIGIDLTAQPPTIRIKYSNGEIALHSLKDHKDDEPNLTTPCSSAR